MTHEKKPVEAPASLVIRKTVQENRSGFRAQDHRHHLAFQ